MIQIKSPCDASWQEMTNAESGKYCGACEKVVVDFSKMNDVEIKNYFAAYKDQKTCGRFLDSQLERPLVVPSLKPLNKFLNRLYQIPVTRTVLLFLTSTSMWISGCVKNNNDGRTTEDTTFIIENNNTQLTDDTTAVIEQHDNLLIKQNPDGIKMGEIAPQQTIKVLPPDVIMGEVAPPTDLLMGDVDFDPDTVAITIPAINPETRDTILHVTMGAVMMTDTISQKIKRRKK